MIYLSKKEVIKRIFFTLNPNSLEFIGVYKFYVRDKKIAQYHPEDDSTKYCLYLSTESNKYGSTMIVSKKLYEQSKWGRFFGDCGVIRNIKRDDFTLITRVTDPDRAIRLTVLKSWGGMLLLMIEAGIALCILSMFMWIFFAFILSFFK